MLTSAYFCRKKLTIARSDRTNLSCSGKKEQFDAVLSANFNKISDEMSGFFLNNTGYQQFFK